MTPPSTVMNSRNPRGGRSSLDLKVNSSILRRYEGPSASRFGPVPSRAKPWRSERRRPTAHKGTDGIAAPIGWRSCRLVFHPCFDRGHRICARRHDHDRQWQATCGKQVSNSTVAAVARRRKFHALASVTTTVIVRSLLDDPPSPNAEAISESSLGPTNTRETSVRRTCLVQTTRKAHQRNGRIARAGCEFRRVEKKAESKHGYPRRSFVARRLPGGREGFLRTSDARMAWT